MATFPERGLAALNGALVRAVDTLLKPALDLPPLVSLLLLALLTAALIVPVIGRTSNQAAVRQTKRRLVAALLEIRLFSDDPRAVLRSLGDALRHNATYLRLSVVPFAVVSVPLLLLVAHLNPFYAYTGLSPGSAALLTVAWRDQDGAPEATISLDTPDAVHVETGPVRLVGTHEVLWRIRPVTRGDFIVTVRVGQHAASKTLHVSDSVRRRSPSRVQPGVFGQLRHPSEPPLDSESPVAAITVTYPRGDIELFGTHVHWMLVYAALTAGWAFVLARRLRISL